MRIINDTAFAAGAIAVKAPPRAPGLTAIVKGTFSLMPGDAAKAAAEQQPLSSDLYAEKDGEEILSYEDDFAPFKSCADILLVGHVARGEPATGTCRVGERGATLANFGPVSRSAGPRAELAGVEAGDWFSYHWPRLAEDCPWDYFNAAPPEMRAEGYLEGGEAVVLENLHPRHESFRARLPGLKVRCFFKPEGGSAAEVPMNLDTAWIDASSDTLVLIWRGQAEADPNLESDLLVVSENLADAPRPAADYEARLDAEEPAKEKPESEKAEEVLAAAGGAPDGLPPDIKLALDDPEAGLPKLSEQANHDDPRFAGLSADEGGGGANAGMDGVATASGEPDAAAPAPLKDFFAGDEQSEEGGDDSETELELEPEEDSGGDDAADSDLLDGMSKQLAGLGLSQTAQDSVVAPGGPSDAKAGSTGTLLLAGQEFDGLPKGVQAVLVDATAVETTTQFLDKVESGAPPPAEAPGPGLEQAIEEEHVPDWPPASAEDLTVMADLTAAYGADRPPRADGAMFLALLAHVAGEDMEPAADDTAEENASLEE